MLDKTGLFSIGHRGAFSFDFEVQIAIQQAVSKVAMSGPYIREVYTYYSTSGNGGSPPKNPPDRCLVSRAFLALIARNIAGVHTDVPFVNRP